MKKKVLVLNPHASMDCVDGLRLIVDEMSFFLAFWEKCGYIRFRVIVCVYACALTVAVE